MTNYSKSTLKTFFEQGDVPSGTNYADLIDSQINIVETGLQSMAGPLATTELITPLVSATTISTPSNFAVGSLGVTRDVSAGGSVFASAAQFTADVSAGGTVYASAARIGFTFNPVSIVSAAGTTQGTGTALATQICRLAGVTDGSATGFTLLANRAGWTQDVYGVNASANLWPPTGGTINALGANAAFALATNTQYRILHLTASAYSVK